MSGGYGLGAAGLTGAGLQQKDEALAVLGRAADQEQQRSITNKQIEAQRKAGNQQLGATVGGLAGAYAGAQAGAGLGPWGAMAGAVVGALASDLF